MNSFNGIGRIVNNLELRVTSGDKSLCNFTIAINDEYGDHQKTNFIDCVIWGKNAENLCKYCDKGVKVAIEGKLQTDTYEKDGKKIKTTKVLVNEITFIEKIKNALNNENTVQNEETKEKINPFEEFSKETENLELPF